MPKTFLISTLDPFLASSRPSVPLAGAFPPALFEVRITLLCAGPSKLLSWGVGTAPSSPGMLSQHREVFNHISTAFAGEIKEAEVQENWH